MENRPARKIRTGGLAATVVPKGRPDSKPLGPYGFPMALVLDIGLSGDDEHEA